MIAGIKKQDVSVIENTLYGQYLIKDSISELLGISLFCPFF